jgi:hypothetical protein
MIAKIEIPEYIRSVELSKKRKSLYYEYGSKHPTAEKYKDAKYQWKEIQGIKNKKFLVDTTTGLRVLRNPKAAGTPKTSVINFQYLYSGHLHPVALTKVMDAMKTQFKPYVDELKEIKCPIKVHYEFHDNITVSGKLWDIDNRALFYVKAFQDCLTGWDKKGVKNCKTIIYDDNIMHLTGFSISYVPIPDNETRKLVIYINEEKNPKVIAQPDYKNKLNEIEEKIQELENLKLSLRA